MWKTNSNQTNSKYLLIIFISHFENYELFSVFAIRIVSTFFRSGYLPEKKDQKNNSWKPMQTK